MPRSLPDQPIGTRTVPEAPPTGGGGGGGIATVPFDSSVQIVPNDTFNLYWFAPGTITISAIKLYYQVAPASAAGTYTFAADGAGNNLLGAATFDLETLVGATLTAMALTGTAADLDLVEGNVVTLSFVSDNIDLTGSGAYVQILYGAT